MVLDFILSFSFFFFFFKISLHTSRFLPLLLVHIYIYVSMFLFYVFIYLYASIFTFLFLVYVRTFEIYISSYDLSTCVPPPLCSTCYIYQLTHITSPCLTLLVYCLQYRPPLFYTLPLALIREHISHKDRKSVV